LLRRRPGQRRKRRGPAIDNGTRQPLTAPNRRSLGARGIIGNAVRKQAHSRISNAAAAPATVSGEPVPLEATGTSREGGDGQRPASQETYRRFAVRRAGCFGRGRVSQCCLPLCLQAGDARREPKAPGWPLPSARARRRARTGLKTRTAGLGRRDLNI
jgi:hypothetical protein